LLTIRHLVEHLGSRARIDIDAEGYAVRFFCQRRRSRGRALQPA
jgi:hypothetical protein